MNVLIVDDQLEILEIIKSFLDDEGIKTHIADNPLRAIEILERKEVDLVISDYNLPHMMGDNLATLIKDKYDIPVILATGDSHAPLNQSIVEFIVKPYDFEYLVRTVKKYKRVENPLHLEAS